MEPTCLADNLLGFSGLPRITPAIPEPMPIPDDFGPVRVVTCEDAWHRWEPEEVVDHTVPWTEERYEGDVATVLAGYRLVAEPLPVELTCLTDQQTPPIVWLIDENGLGMRPAGLPTGECGAFKWDAISAIHAPPLTKRIVPRIPLSPVTGARFDGEPRLTLGFTKGTRHTDGNAARFET